VCESLKEEKQGLGLVGDFLGVGPRMHVMCSKSPCTDESPFHRQSGAWKGRKAGLAAAAGL
jgi:hypothetical protein